MTLSLATGLLIGASLLLAGTALFHATGHEMAATMVEPRVAPVQRMIWLNATIGWLVIAKLWLVAAFRPGREWALVAVLAAVYPIASGLSLWLAAGPGHPGVWMLLASALLAIIAAWSRR